MPSLNAQLLRRPFDDAQIDKIAGVMEQVTAYANELRSIIDGSGLSIEKFYQGHNTLIVVPERSDPSSLCRVEYITGWSPAFSEHVVEPIQSLLEQKLDRRLRLFKDKCNYKNPKGGAFPPHQDAAAYLGMGPKYFVTVAYFLDEATAINGCLCLSSNALAVSRRHGIPISTEFGDHWLLPTYSTGAQNGELVENVTSELEWFDVPGAPGDLLIFDAFEPHFSRLNASSSPRRAIFLTFNLAEAGEHYDAYYRRKFLNYGDPKFHIATPTKHDALGN
jgi:hypothetical protein